MDRHDGLVCVKLFRNRVGNVYDVRKAAHCSMNSVNCEFIGVLVLEKCLDFLQFWYRLSEGAAYENGIGKNIRQHGAPPYNRKGAWIKENLVSRSLGWYSMVGSNRA